MRWMLAVAIVAFCAGLTAQAPGRRKLLAKRAAELDAYRKLAEYVKGLKISSKTTVRDFVTESDRINSSFRTAIKGARITAVRYLDDGTCEVDMELTIERVIEELERIKKRVYRGGAWRDVVFENIKRYAERKKIEATGAGAAREALLADRKAQDNYISPDPSRKRDWSGMKIWEDAHPRDRLMAKRGAEQQAIARLAEYIKGLKISGSTTVRDFVTRSDEVRSEFEHFIKGVRITGYTYYPDGTVEAEAEVTIERVVEELTRIKKRVFGAGGWRDVVMEDIKRSTERKLIKAVGVNTLGSKYTDRTAERPPAATGPAPAVQKRPPPEWARRTVEATGTGVPPEDAESREQAQLLAERAAERDALRKLAEAIYGLKVKGETTVKDFVAEKAVVKTELRKALIVGAGRTARKTGPDGTVELTLKVDLREVWRVLERHMGPGGGGAGKKEEDE